MSAAYGLSWLQKNVTAARWTKENAPRLSLQLVLGPDRVAAGRRAAVIVYDLDLYLGRRKDGGHPYGETAAHFSGDGKSPWITLPPGAKAAVESGAMERDVDQAGSGVLSFGVVKFQLRGDAERAALTSRHGPQGWCPYYVEAEAPPRRFAGEAGYALELWTDRRTVDVAGKWVQPSPRAPLPWLGPLASIVYPAEDLRRVTPPQRVIAVRFVALDEVAPSVPPGTVFLATTNPANNPGTTRLVLDHARQRELLGRPGGGAVEPTGTSALESHVAAPDLTGHYEEVPEGVDPVTSDFVSPSRLLLSQAGHARVGWFEPYGQLMSGVASASPPPLVGYNAVFRGKLTPGAADGLTVVDWIRVDELRWDPGHIDEPPAGNVTTERVRVELRVLRTRPRTVIELRMFAITDTSRLVKTGRFVRRSPRTRLPWAAVDRVGVGMLVNEADVDMVQLKAAVVAAEVQPQPAKLLDLIADRVAPAALRPAVDEFEDGKTLSAFQLASRELEAAMNAFSGPRQLYAADAVQRLHYFARTTPIKSKRGSTASAFDWLTRMLDARIQEHAGKIVTTDADIEKALDSVFRQEKGRGFQLAQIAASGKNTYALKFGSVAKRGKDVEVEGPKASGKTAVVGIGAEVFSLEVTVSGPVAERWGGTHTYLGLLASVGTGFEFKFGLGSGEGGLGSSGGSGGAVDCTLTSFVPIEPNDLHHAIFAIAAVTLPGAIGTPFDSIGLEASSALFSLRVSPRIGPAVTLSAVVEKIYEPKAELPKLPEAQDLANWTDISKDDDGKEQTGFQKMLEDKKKLEFKIALFGLSETLGFLVKSSESRELARRMAPTVARLVSKEQHVPVDITADPELILFEVGRATVIEAARERLEYRLAAYRRLIEMPGWIAAAGFSSPEWSAKVPDKDARNEALSADRARAVMMAVRAAIGGPGGGVWPPGRARTESAQGFGPRGAYKVGGLLDPDRLDAALVCDACGRTYASPEVLDEVLRDAKVQASGVCVAGHPVRAMQLAEARAKVAKDAASYPEWRRVDLVINGQLVARFTADGPVP